MEIVKLEYYLAHWVIPPRPAEFKHVTAYAIYNPEDESSEYVRFDGSKAEKSAARLKKIPVTLEFAENYRQTFTQPA